MVQESPSLPCWLEPCPPPSSPMPQALLYPTCQVRVF